jgi:hypothetical protein
MNFIFTITLTVLLAFAGSAMASNASAFQHAREAARRINSLIDQGATDTDCTEIGAAFDMLAKLRTSLTAAQQRVIWERYPYMGGIACSRAFAHAWSGNDCAFQCGSLAECKSGVIE